MRGKRSSAYISAMSILVIASSRRSLSSPSRVIGGVSMGGDAGPPHTDADYRLTVSMNEAACPGARRPSMPEGVMRLASAGCEIPEPRMSQLPTNPILDRSGTPVLTGEYQQDSPSTVLQ